MVESASRDRPINRDHSASRYPVRTINRRIHNEPHTSRPTNLMARSASAVCGTWWCNGDRRVGDANVQRPYSWRCGNNQQDPQPPINRVHATVAGDLYHTPGYGLIDIRCGRGYCERLCFVSFASPKACLIPLLRIIDRCGVSVGLCGLPRPLTTFGTAASIAWTREFHSLPSSAAETVQP